MSTKKQDIIAGAGLVLTALLLYFYLVPTWVADNESGAMSSRFFPYIGTLLIGLGGVFMIVTAVLTPSVTASDGSDEETVTPIKPLLIVLAMAIFVLIFQWFGYLYAAPLMIAAMMVVFGCRNPVAIVLVSAVTTTGLFVLFSYGLRLPLA